MYQKQTGVLAASYLITVIPTIKNGNGIPMNISMSL